MKISIINIMDPPATAMAMIVTVVGVADVLMVFVVVVTGVEDDDVGGAADVLTVFVEVVSVVKDGVICVPGVELIIGDVEGYGVVFDDEVSLLLVLFGVVEEDIDGVGIDGELTVLESVGFRSQITTISMQTKSISPAVKHNSLVLYVHSSVHIHIYISVVSAGLLASNPKACECYYTTATCIVLH